MRVLSALISLLPLATLGQSVNPAFLANDKPTLPIIQPANEGLFSFKKDDSYGFADKDMKVVIPAQFQFGLPGKPSTAAIFEKGRAIVRQEGKWFVIDRTGKRLSPLFSERIIDYNLGAGLYVLQDDILKWNYVMNAEGKKLTKLMPYIQLDSNLFITRKPHPLIKGKEILTLLDASGKELLGEKMQGLDTYSTIAVNREEGVIIASDGLWNYLYNLNMAVLLKLPRYFIPVKKKGLAGMDVVLGNAEGYFMKDPNSTDRQMHFYSVSKGRVFFKDNYEKDGKFGMIDFQGNLVMEPRYDYISYRFDKYGMCYVSKKDNITKMHLNGYIDRNGKEIFPTGEGTPILNHHLPAGIARDPKTKLYGVMDRSGKWMVAPTYIEAFQGDRFGGFQAKKKNENVYRYFDLNGKDYGIVPPSGELLKFETSEDGYAIVYLPDTALRVADVNGMLSEAVADCSEYGAFSNGRAIIRSGSTGKLGFIDSTGKVAVQCEYVNLAAFQDEVTLAVKDVQGKNLAGYIDKKGKVILPIQHERIGAFRNGYGIVQTEAGFFYVDRTGKLKPAPAEFGSEFTEFNSGLALGVSQGSDGGKTFTYFDNNFRKVFSMVAKDAGQFNGNMLLASPTYGEIAVYDRNGTKVKPLSLQGLQGANPCGEGKLALKYNDKWGVMNEKGDMIVQPKYDSVKAFVGNRAAVRLGNLWGVIDEKDNKVVDFKYDFIELGDGGLITYSEKKGSWGVMYASGERVFPRYLKHASAFREGKGLVRGAYKPVIVRSPLAR